MDKQAKEQIKKLKKEKDYDGIYRKYGKKAYQKITPYSYRKKDIKKLFKEGRWEEIYFKYGKDTYNSLLGKMEQKEIERETGSKWKGRLARAKFLFKKRILPISMAVLLTPPVGGMISSTAAKYEAEKEYAPRIEEYQSAIADYASEVKSLALENKTQIVMKVMEDMWESIKGYGEPQDTVDGYLGMDLYENGVGVCRNMADDVARKLNAIDSSFNARTYCVYATDGKYTAADIERTILQEEEESTSTEQVDNTLQETATKIFGNHMVVAVDIPENQVTLILDPTNPGIGIFYQNQIHMFNSAKEGGVDYTPKILGDSICRGLEAMSLPLDMMKSFIPPKLSFKKLEELYGTDAQNAALERIQIIESEKKKDDFKERIRIVTDKEGRPVVIVNPNTEVQEQEQGQGKTEQQMENSEVR